MEYIFNVETIMDLPVHREAQKGWVRAGIPKAILLIIGGIYLLYTAIIAYSTFLVYAYLFAFVLWMIVLLRENWKGGNIQYKRMLLNNDGKPYHIIYTLTEENILIRHRDNSGNSTVSYDRFQSIIDTGNLFLLTTKYRQYYILEKRWIKGGTPQELADFLLSKCPNVRKKVRRIGLGKWAFRIYAALLIASALIMVSKLPYINLWDKVTGKLGNDMSYEQMAEELAELDITISPETIDELNAYDTDYWNEFSEEYYIANYTYSKVSDLLYWEGSGHIDPETWQWTPSTSGIYYLDTEMWNADTMYTDLLTGISAMDPELIFENVTEDYSKADLYAGTGTVTVSFEYDGQPHTVTAQYYYDWLDPSALQVLGSILARDDSSQDLYYAYDGGQGFILYYGTAMQAWKLSLKTGLNFRSASVLIYS